LPAPFGPVKTSALPAATEKPTPQNTLRPPRTQAKSWPDSFIPMISHTLAPLPPPCPPRLERGRRARLKKSGRDACAPGWGQQADAFFLLRLVQKHRSYGRTTKKSV